MAGRVLWFTWSVWVCAVMALGAMAADQRWLNRFENGESYAEDCTASFVSRRVYATNIDIAEDASVSTRRPAAPHVRPSAVADQPARCVNTRLALSAMKSHPDTRFARAAHAR